jgi:hypothetical protein
MPLLHEFGSSSDARSLLSGWSSSKKTWSGHGSQKCVQVNACVKSVRVLQKLNRQFEEFADLTRVGS